MAFRFARAQTAEFDESSWRAARIWLRESGLSVRQICTWFQVPFSLSFYKIMRSEQYLPRRSSSLSRMLCERAIRLHKENAEIPCKSDLLGDLDVAPQASEQLDTFLESSLQTLDDLKNSKNESATDNATVSWQLDESGSFISVTFFFRDVDPRDQQSFKQAISSIQSNPAFASLKVSAEFVTTVNLTG